MKGAGRSADIEGLVLTPEDLQLPDEELGIRLLSICIAAEAVTRGIPLNEITVENEFAVKFASWVLEKLPDLESDRHDLATIEKALRKAAGGQTELAGRLLRDHVVNNALNVATVNRLVAEMQSKLRGPKAGGRKTAQVLKAEKADRNKDICAAATDLEQSGHSPSSINSKLAQRFPLSAGQIRRIRKSAK